MTEVFGRPPTAPDWRTLRRVRLFIIMIRTDDEMNRNVGESQSLLITHMHQLTLQVWLARERLCRGAHAWAHTPRATGVRHSTHRRLAAA